MDAISALASIPASNAIGGVAAPASTRGSQASTAAASAASAFGAEPSVFVQFSTYVRNLLAQKALDPNLNIDAALAKNLSGLVPDASTGGQLYTSTGLLQQYATSLVSQLDGSVGNDTQTLADIADAAQQAALGADLTLLDQTSPTAQAATPVSTTAETPSQNTASGTGTEATAAAVQLAPQVTAPEATPQVSNPATAVAQVDNANSVVTPPSAAIGDDVASDNLDAYRQAALVGGLTSFGKEQRAFVQASTDATLDSPIGPVAAITRIKPRSDVPEDAQASALS